MLTRIDEFLHDLACQHPDREIDNQVSMLTRQRLLFALDERILKLCDLLSETPPHSHLEKWRMGIIEGIRRGVDGAHRHAECGRRRLLSDRRATDQRPRRADAQDA